MTDDDVRQDVQMALEWEPGIDQRAIGVSVDGGVVSLRGNVGSLAEKAKAERVALHVYGVTADGGDLAVRHPSDHEQ